MKPGNYVELTIKLNLERWDNIFESASTHWKVEDFTSTLISILNTTIAMKPVGMHQSDKPCMTTRIKVNRNTCTQQPLASFAELFSVIAVILLINIAIPLKSNSCSKTCSEHFTQNASHSTILIGLFYYLFCKY